MKSNYDIAIVGAGLIGAALALRLASQTNLSIAVLERAAQIQRNDKPNLRVIALGAIATEILNQCGVLSELGDSACHPYLGMRVWDEFSNGQLDFSASEFELDQLGHMIDGVQCTLLLQQALVENESIDVFFEAELESAEFNRSLATLTLAGEKPSAVVTAQLVVAADGPGSWVRQQAGIFVNHHSYQQLGIVARVESEKPHQETAWQRFLEHGPIAFLPIEKNQSSIVWSVSESQAEALLAMAPEAFEAALAQALDKKLGSVKLLSERLSFPLRSQRAERYVTHHLVLIGDAAHSIHPLAGQGANLGFKDIKCLVSLLAQAQSGQVGALPVLEKYQRERRADNEQTDRAMSALDHAFGQEHAGVWLAARGIGMNIISQSKRLKKLLVAQASGL